MEIAFPLFLFIVGLAILIVASESLIRGSMLTAYALGIRPIVIGLTVVAYGTSAPELMVSLFAVLGQDTPAFGIVLGNVIGSNIANLGLILGVAALIRPFQMEKSYFTFEFPLMVLATGAFWLTCLDGEIARWEGAILATAALVFTVWSYKRTPRSTRPAEGRKEVGTSSRQTPQLKHHGLQLTGDGGKDRSSSRRGWIMLALGLVGLLAGAKLMVDSALILATQWGISDVVVGLSLIAVGTSLPELATCITAAIRKAEAISLGNVIGSNIFNVFVVVGVTALIRPIIIPPAMLPWLLKFQFPILAAFTIGVIPMFASGMQLNRFEGAALLVFYAIYLSATFMAAGTSP